VASIIYDHREERSNIPGLLALEGFQMYSQQLPIGDYILSDRLVIERKSAADLVASIKDRRLWEQANRLKEAYTHVILIVEGQEIRFPEQSWKGALAAVMTIGGISVLQTKDDEDTVEWIARLARREEKGPSSARGSKKKSRDPQKLSEEVLASLPGISSKGAKALLVHFGSLQAIFSAHTDDLVKVPGIGKKRAVELELLFSRTYDVPTPEDTQPL
jgi:DNA excision repair protein ERCC-4